MAKSSRSLRPRASRRTRSAPSSSASSGWKKKSSAIADDIKEIYAEAKGNGFDSKVLRQIVRIRKQDASRAHRSRKRCSSFI